MKKFNVRRRAKPIPKIKIIALVTILAVILYLIIKL